jgi:hypothetical protein
MNPNYSYEDDSDVEADEEDWPIDPTLHSPARYGKKDRSDSPDRTGLEPDEHDEERETRKEAEREARWAKYEQSIWDQVRDDRLKKAAAVREEKKVALEKKESKQRAWDRGNPHFLGGGVTYIPFKVREVVPFPWQVKH